MLRYLVNVKGIVQSVGFRPFIYNEAIKNNLSGYVLNDSKGVTIEIQGRQKDIFNFLDILKNNPPQLSRIEDIYTTPISIINEVDFEIRESNEEKSGTTLISADVAICDECIKDMTREESLRYKYPFTNCTSCGPRYSIIKGGIYDRKNTSMDNFIMCDECKREYLDVKDRRFHAEATCCKECGPKLWVCNNEGKKICIGNDKSIKFIVDKIKEGKIIAIKSLGGFALVCDSFNSESVKALRKRKNRPHKPFAIMMKSIDEVNKYCSINTVEEDILLGKKKPIVILSLNNGIDIFNEVAPNRNTVGVMLPYTPLHILLFEDEKIEGLVMTSGNISGRPIEYKNEEALLNLKDVADYFLLNDRDILSSIDDSVVRVIAGKGRVFRRARGYESKVLDLSCKSGFLALGANMQSTFAMTKDNYIFLSPYNGNLDNFYVYKEYLERIERYRKLFCFKEEIAVYDKHPAYISSKFGAEICSKGYEVYHHHAHIVSCMMENKITERVIGVAFDGTGFGEDKKIWGGEILTCDYLTFNREAHLGYITLPGGDKAIKEIWRIGVSCIYNALKDTNINCKDRYEEIIYSFYDDKGLKMLQVIKKDINCIESSSIGRLFDAVASILGLVGVISYEGQGAMELEALIDKELEVVDYYEFELLEEQDIIIEYYNIIIGIIEDLFKKIDKKIIATKFHNTIVKIIVGSCKLIRDKTGINKVALSGGCFQNKYLLENTILALEKYDFKVYSHYEVPTNDGGISLGQIGIASAMYNNRL